MLDPGQQSTARYSAFISYSRQDIRLARWLQSALESYRMPRRLVGTPTPYGPVPGRFRPVFLDQSDLTAAPDLLDELSHSLADSGHLIVLCTPQAARSDWVDQEIRLMQALGRGADILAALFEGDEHESFPPALVGPGGSRQPLAADFRKSGDGRRLALLKLVAAMSGIGLGELVHREESRRARRLITVVAASVAGMAAFGGLSLYAMQAREQAEAERRKSEAMVNSLVTDLRGAVKPAGNLAMLDKVNEAAVAYFRGQSLQNMPDAALAARARLLMAMGEDEATRGDLSTARSHFEEAARTTAARLAAGPRDPQRIFDHAQAEYWLGHYAWSSGNPADARRAWNQYARLADQLVTMQPTRPDWRLEAGYAQSNLGILDLRQDLDVAAADQRFRSAIRHYRDALALAPDDPVAMADLADGLAWLADSQRVGGQLAEARDTRAEQARMLRQAASRHPGDIGFRIGLVGNEIANGRIADAAGDPQRASAHFRTAREAAARAAADDPQSAVLAATLRMAQLWETRSRLIAGNRQAAAGLACASPDIADPFAEPEDWCRLVQARAALLRGDRAAARSLAAAVSGARQTPGAPRLSARFGLDYAAEIKGLEQQAGGQQERTGR